MSEANVIAERLPNGNILVPRRVGKLGCTVGRVYDEISPDDPEYEKWKGFIREEPRKRRQPGEPLRIPGRKPIW